MFDHLLTAKGVRGIIRFVARPAFEAPKYSTFVYTSNSVVASLFVRGVGLWDVLPLLANEQILQEDVLEQIVPSLSFQVYDFQRLAASRYGVDGNCPQEINSWDKVRSLVNEASSCHAPVCDGVIYDHRMYDRMTTLRASWMNPDPIDHPIQSTLITAYSRLIARANLTPKLVKDAFGIIENEVFEEPFLRHFYGDEVVEDDTNERRGKKRRKPWQH